MKLAKNVCVMLILLELVGKSLLVNGLACVRVWGQLSAKLTFSQN